MHNTERDKDFKKQTRPATTLHFHGSLENVTQQTFKYGPLEQAMLWDCLIQKNIKSREVDKHPMCFLQDAYFCFHVLRELQNGVNPCPGIWVVLEVCEDFLSNSLLKENRKVWKNIIRDILPDTPTTTILKLSQKFTWKKR